VSSVVGVEAYKHAAGVFQSGSGESGSEALSRRSAMCMASSFVPLPGKADQGETMEENASATDEAKALAARRNVQDGNIFHAGGPNGGGGEMRGDSVAAIWPALEVIRDPYTKASQGVVLTWVTLWDLEAAFRSAAYRRVAFRLAAA